MKETYPTEPTLLLSKDIYALQLSIFEDGAEMAYHKYEEEDQFAIRQCLDDMMDVYGGQFTFELDSVLGADNEWTTVLVCRVDGYRVPFPLAILEKIVYYSSGTERHLVGEKLHIHPRSNTYKWAKRVEIRLDEFEDE
jgi:hypothetical protein